MASGVGSPRKLDLLKQASQNSIATVESLEGFSEEAGDVDAIMNRRWKFDEVSGILETQLAALPGGRDRNGGAIIIMQGLDGLEYTFSNVGKVLSYLSKLPEDSVQRKGFTVILDMRMGSWSQAKRALEALKLAFVEHINQVLVMRPKSFWQRGKSSMSFSLNKSKYRFKCTLLEHSGDLFHHLSIAQVPKAQNGQLEYDHHQWMEILKTTEQYLIQLIDKHENYLVLQEILYNSPEISSLQDARDAVKYHVNLRQQLDRSSLSDLCEAVSHTISRLRPLTSNPDFDSMFSKLEDLCSQLHTLLGQLEMLWERKGEQLDRILQYKIFDSDATQHTDWLRNHSSAIGKTMTDIGQSVSDAEQNKQDFEGYRHQVNSRHQDIDRTIKMGERLVAINHPDSQAIKLRCEELGEKWEDLSEMVEERMGMMFLAVHFYSKQDKFLLKSEQWIDQCGSRSKPKDVKETELALEAHRIIMDTYTDLYSQVKQDGHNLIEKLRKPVGNLGVPREFTLATRFIKECLENLYDEKNLVDDQWHLRQDHLKKTLNFRLFQRDTNKIFKWIEEVGEHFLLSNTSIGSDINSATKLLKAHDAFESDSELPVVYSQSNLINTRAKELISAKDCRTEEVEEEAKRLEHQINLFASRLDERRDVLVLTVECFKACDNFIGELASLKAEVPREKFEGTLLELEERFGRFRTHRDIIRKISSSTFKHWSSLMERLKSIHKSKTDSGHPVNYSAAIKTAEQKISWMENEKQMTEGVCQQRENHWSLSIERFSLITRMSKHLDQQESWLENQSMETELSECLSDAELQRDIFKRQYDQQKEDSDLLIERGWEVNEHLSELDMMMFGEGVVTGKVTKEQLEVAIVKVEKGKDKMMKMAEPRLKQLNECLQYYQLEASSRKLSDSFKQISGSLFSLVGIGRTLEEGRGIQKALQEVEEQFMAVLSEVEIFLKSVKDCTAAGHYQTATLNMLGRTISEKMRQFNKALKEKRVVVKGAVDFHSNYDKLKHTLEHCQTQFSSREMGTSHSQIETQMATMKEMRTHLEEAVQVVKSHADQLVTILGKSQPDHEVTPMPKKAGSYEDLLGTPADGAPRLLVSPKKVRHGRSMSPGTSTVTEQQIIENLIRDIDSKVSRVIRLWETRHSRLGQSKQVLLFEEEVPKVLKWVDQVGVVFLTSHKEYGKSLEEVKKLIEEFEMFSNEKVKGVAEQVEQLRKMMKQFEEMGHYELNRIRSIGTHLEQQWNRFEKDAKLYISNLKLSLEFQEKLFDGSNWCMQSEQFLQSLDDKINRCETSEEVGSLSAELAVYLLVTQEEQLERVSRIKQISSILHSNLLVEVSHQLAQSTQHIIRDFETVKQELQKLHTKFVQIEEEKDRERRWMKQKERVIEELMNTERTYVQDLRLVAETCKPRFISDFLPDSLRGKETVVFGNIQWIAEFHVETLHPALIAAEGDIHKIAQVFIDNVDVMTDLYVPYCKNKTASEELLASHRSYLSRVQSLFGTDTPLSSLLIKPIQRITKYPLLLKDALKYQKNLNLPTETLEVAIMAVEEIPVQTNNAINLSLLESEEGLKWHKYGELLYQGSLLVSEPRLLITSEKERQVFVFENTIAFARRIELGQAKFKYEYKFRIPLTAGVQVLEFIEGEPCKFALFTSDHRMHFRASSIDIKQRWVKALRIAIHKHVEEETMRVRSMTETNRKRSNTILTNDKAAVDLGERRRSPLHLVPRRPSSPFTKSRINLPNIETRSSPVAFDLYKVTVDYEPFADDHHGISLKKDQKVELMEELDGGRCFVRATTITGEVEHGWVPSSILEVLPPEILFNDEDQFPSEETDQGSSLEHGSRRNTSAAAFGSRDIASQQVISSLKKVTLGDLAPPSPRSTSPRGSPSVFKKSSGRISPSLDKQNEKPPMSPRHDRRSLSPQPSSPSHPNSSNCNGDPPGSPRVIRLARKAVVRRPSNKHHGVQSASSLSVDDTEIRKSSSEESFTEPLEALDEKSEENEEEAKERKEKAEQKLKYIMAELVETEREYVTKLDKLVNGFLKEVQESSSLPESLVGKEKMIFGNVTAIYEFHRDVFKNLLEENKDSLEGIARCFLDKRAEFHVYVAYCENKPKSESFIWTFTHQGGTFFTEIQKKLNLREDIASFLIKPVQRITKYQLLLKDLFKTSQKMGLDLPALEESVQLMQDVPKQANDAMALSMIVGYQGNIHANGQIIKQDEFTVYEKSRWAGGARRHVFLLDRVIIITKEKDSDGLYVFKDSLKVHNMTLTENVDSTSRFAIGTGPIRDPEKYYLFEAGTPEKKLEWTKIVKELLNQQFEMLKALKQPNRNRVSTVESTPSIDSNSPATHRASVANSEYGIDDISDSDLDDDSDEEVPSSSSFAPRRRSKVLVQDDDTRKYIPYTVSRSPSGSPNPRSPRVPKLFIVGDDCAPPVDGQKILYIKKGQIYDMLSQTGNWWLGKLIRDVPGGAMSRGTEGWVPSTFMDPFQGQLSYEEEVFTKWGDGKMTGNSKGGSNSKHGMYSTLPSRLKDPSLPNSTNVRNSVFPLFSRAEEKKKDPTRTPKGQRKIKSNAPRIITHIADETVLRGQDAQFKCLMAEDYSGLTVDWEYNGKPLSREKSFSSSGKVCLLKIQDVCPVDEGVYTCIASLPSGGSASSSAKLTVLGPPQAPGRPNVRPITSTSVSLSWTPPIFDGHAPITVYIVECKDTQGNRWSTLMKRIKEPATIITDLVPGTEYVFRVLASNNVGASEPSQESRPVYLSRQETDQQTVFSLEAFDNHYALVNELAKGQFSTVYECLHETTQQSYVAKLIPLSVGRDHAYNELSILSRLNHPNIVQMTSAYLTEKNYILVMHYIHGVPIFEYFISSHSQAPSAVVTQSVFLVLSALAYLHEYHIAHLAIRPKNILVREQSNGTLDVKLIHLSQAREISKEVIASPSEARFEYNAPELLLNVPVTTATDMWSVGVLLYTLLGGTPPFAVESLDLTKENIKKVRFSFPSRLFKGMAEEPKKLIQLLLQKDQSARPMASQCLQEVWLQTGMVGSKQGWRVLDMSRLKSHLERTSV